ncbi:hypothetical protein EMCRGX_G014740 [Ephydatia muelleri]
MASSDSAAGYDCEFVELPPKLLQTECSICLSILREPHLISCCGHSFCRVCIETVQKARQPCPLCKDAAFSTLRNKGLERSLRELTVTCEKKDVGCSWRGELGRLEEHLNIACPCVEVKCQYADCRTIARRADILSHQASCGLRPFRCEWCQQYDSRYDDVVKHWPLCPKFLVECAECKKMVERQNLSHHVDDECPLALVNCEFSNVGCTTRLLRKDCQAHLNAEMVVHVTMMNRKLLNENGILAGRVLELETKMADEIEKFEAQVHDLEDKVADMKRELYAVSKKEKVLVSYVFKTSDNQPRIVPIRLEIKFNSKMQPGAIKTCIFYSHFGGYKMELQLYIKEVFSPALNNYGGIGIRLYNIPDIHVRIRIVEGDFDDCLQWPFCGTVVVCLEPDKRHYINFKDAPLQCKLKRAPEGQAWYDPPGIFFLGQMYNTTIQNLIVEQVLLN